MEIGQTRRASARSSAKSPSNETAIIHFPRAVPEPAILLMECLVYIAVFAVILGLGLATFYRLLGQLEGVDYATDDIAAALRAGERWRADIRGATGKITVETNAAGELLRIPRGTNEILYQFQCR